MNRNKIRLQYIFWDFLAALITWVLFMLFRRIVNDLQIFHDMKIFIPNYNYLTSLALFPFSCFVVHCLSGFYLNPQKHNTLFIFLTTLTVSAIISVSIFFVLMLDDIVVSYDYYYKALVVLLSLLFLFTFSFRLIVAHGIKNNYKTGKWSINTIIIGTGKNAQKIAQAIEKKSGKYKLAGFVQVDQYILVPKEQIIGHMAGIEKIIFDNNISDAIIALEEPDEYMLFKIINSLYKYNIDIRFTPRLYEILTGSARIGNLGIQPLVNITNLHMPDWQISLKRSFDIVISGISLIILSPFFLYYAIKIKIDSRGPVFYTQERIGLYGKAFNIIKFRTMYVDAENGVPKLSSATDDRITKVGRTLRKYRIDELPQFWNILKGEMSLVGPRPERRYYINQIIEQAPYYCLLYKIRPGLTSWGPIKIGYSDTIDKMIERLNYDIIYVENMSLLNDIKILVLTLEIIFKGKGV
ncbi:MAG: sugar transferase [Paludibacter sp.]|nr:sugar transferase [Paludibacter sp.]